jgi:diacylglycerol kinase (ATP)
MIQDLNDDRIGHIDSPETSETTDALHGESLIDDMSSVLGHDLFGALQDSTLTDDTTTLCSAHEFPNLPRTNSTRNRSFKKRVTRTSSQSNEPATQFGFENRIFDLPDIDVAIHSGSNNAKNVNDIEPPKRYCSLAKFEEGNDIARKSFKVSQRTKSASVKQQLSSRKYFTQQCSSEIEEAINFSETTMTTTSAATTVAEKPIECDRDKINMLNTIKIQIQVSVYQYIH